MENFPNDESLTAFVKNEDFLNKPNYSFATPFFFKNFASTSGSGTRYRDTDARINEQISYSYFNIVPDSLLVSKLQYFERKFI